jgi:hypothetical protein
MSCYSCEKKQWLGGTENVRVCIDRIRNQISQTMNTYTQDPTMFCSIRFEHCNPETSHMEFITHEADFFLLHPSEILSLIDVIAYQCVSRAVQTIQFTWFRCIGGKCRIIPASASRVTFVNSYALATINNTTNTAVNYVMRKAVTVLDAAYGTAATSLRYMTGADRSRIAHADNSRAVPNSQKHRCTTEKGLNRILKKTGDTLYDSDLYTIKMTLPNEDTVTYLDSELTGTELNILIDAGILGHTCFHMEATHITISIPGYSETTIPICEVNRQTRYVKS